MSLLFTKKDVTDEEYIVKYALTYLGMKKIKDESVDKILKSDENKLVTAPNLLGLHSPISTAVLTSSSRCPLVPKDSSSFSSPHFLQILRRSLCWSSRPAKTRSPASPRESTRRSYLWRSTAPFSRTSTILAP